jgi:hypothetical protein
MGNGLLAFAAGLGSGYLTAKQRGLDQQVLEEERAMRRTAFENQQDEVTRLKRDRASLADAGKLATVNPDGAVLSLADGTNTVYSDPGVANSDFLQLRRSEEATGTQTLARTADGTMPQAPQSAPVANNKAYSTLADANAAAAEYNKPEAVNDRIANVYRDQGNPLQALQYGTAAKQASLADMEMASKVWGKDLRDAMINGHGGISKLITRSQGSQLAGKEVKDVDNGDGTVTYHKVNKDGTTEALPGLTFKNSPEGVIQAAYMLDSNITPESRYTHSINEKKQTEDRDMKLKELKLKERELEEVKIPTAESRAALAEIRVQLAQFRAGNTASLTPPIWNDKADEFLKSRFTSKNPDTGAIEVDGHGLQFAKQVALARAQQNGGDVTTALGYAFDIDSKIKSSTKGDPAAIRAGREAYIQSIFKKPTPVAAPGLGNNQAPTPAAPSAAPAKPSLATPASPAPAKTSSAIDVAGEKLDKAREDLKVIQQGQRPGLAQGRTAIDAYGSKLAEAKKKVDQLEREYQSLIPKQTAAFVGQK